MEKLLGLYLGTNRTAMNFVLNDIFCFSRKQPNNHVSIQINDGVYPNGEKVSL